jgi:hypothetical protein
MAGAMRERTRQTIAATLAGGGLWAFVLVAELLGVLREQWPIAVAEGQKAVFFANSVILLGFAALASGAVLGGVLLWKDKRLGRRISIVVLAVQVVFIAVPHFQYKMALLGFLGFGLTGSRFGLFAETNTQMFLEFDPDDLRAFVVNIPALLMLIALAKTSPKLADQRESVSAEAPSADVSTG